MNREEIIKQIERVAEKTFEVDMQWDWSAGVAFYGVACAYEATGNKKYLDLLKSWIDNYLEVDGLPDFTVNSIAMGHCLITLYEAVQEEKYLEIIRKKAEYLKNDAIRFADGVLQHTVTQNYNFDKQAWADTLFMAGYFLIRAGRLLDDEESYRDGLNQFHWHIEYLFDDENYLFYHGYDDNSKSNMSGVHWARANAWCLLTMACVGSYADAFEPVFVEIIDTLRDCISKVVKLQAEDGMWHTVIDADDCYTETSAAAGIACAIMKYNSLTGITRYTECLKKAYVGLTSRIRADGRVTGVSGGTAVMRTEEDYKRIPCKAMQGWGQGLMLAYLAELLNSAAEEQ